MIRSSDAITLILIVALLVWALPDLAVWLGGAQ